MCLEVIATISANAKGRISDERLSQMTGLSISSRRFSGEPALHFAVTGGCSCEFLSDEAEVESEIWQLEVSHLPALAQAVAALGKECKGFSFLAYWLNGERPRQSLHISASALVKLVRQNKVGNNVLYVVG